MTAGSLGAILAASSLAAATVLPVPAENVAANSAARVPVSRQTAPRSAPQPRMSVAADRNTVAVGDPITLTIAVEHAPGSVVAWPDSLDLAPFEVFEAEALPASGEGDRQPSRLRLKLAAFELGELVVPGVRVTVVDPSGARVELVSDEYRVSVVSVGLDEGGDIRDIRGPLSIPLGITVVLAWVVLLAAAAWIAWFLWRRRGRSAKPRAAPEVPPPPAHEVAYTALAHLEASGLLERGEVQAYHIAVSAIVRTYVEARFGVPALEMTTGEVLDGLAGLHGGQTDADLRRFLERADLVKFAKLRPPPEASREMVVLARGFVDRTRARSDERSAEDLRTPTPEGAEQATSTLADAGAEGASAPATASAEGA